MASLSTPLSVRLSDEDIAFLAALQLEGAVTASDKIRALIRQARDQASEAGSYVHALKVSHDQMAPAMRGIRLLEDECGGVHSDVETSLMALAEEYLALALAAPAPDAGASLDDLVAHEDRLVDCATRMTGLLLRWGVTPRAPAYDEAVVARHLGSILDLMTLISAATAAREEAKR